MTDIKIHRPLFHSTMGGLLWDKNLILMHVPVFFFHALTEKVYLRSGSLQSLKNISPAHWSTCILARFPKY